MRTRSAIRREYFIKSTAVIGIVSLCVFAVIKIEDLLLSFVLAFVINYMLTPPVNALERKGISRKAGVLLLFTIIGILAAFFTIKALPGIVGQIQSFKSELPKYSSGLTDLFSRVEKALEAFFPNFLNIDFGRKTGSILTSFSAGFFDNLPRVLSTSLSVIIMAPLLAFFMLIDGRAALKKLLAIVPNPFFETALNLLYQINIQIGGFIRARLLEALIVGFVVWTGLFFIGFPYAVLFAVFAGLTNLIPYIGPVIGTIPPVLVSAINGAGPMEIITLISVFVFAQIIDAVVIVPMVVARIVDLHAVIVIIVIIFGAQVGGILGMVISIPVTSIIKLIVITIYEHLIEHNLQR